MLEGYARRHFELVGAAGRFLMAVSSVANAEARHALDTFVAVIQESGVARADLDAVLIQCLLVIQRRRRSYEPNLVDQFTRALEAIPDPVRRFQRCIELDLAQRTYGSIDMQRVAAFVHCHLRTHLTSESIARCLDLSPARVRAVVQEHTRQPLAAFVRDVRLERAADRLRHGASRIKDVWSEVGYGDASNFVHEFRIRFGATPSEYRARWPASIAWNDPDKEDDALEESHADVRGRVLLVDDDLSMRETLSVFLSSVGFNVVTAANGREAVRLGRFRSIDVGIVDYRLPDMDGIDCLRALIRQRTARPSRLVLFTADWSAEEREDELRAIGVQLAFKLCDLEDVESIVRRAMTAA